MIPFLDVPVAGLLVLVAGVLMPGWCLLSWIPEEHLGTPGRNGALLLAGGLAIVWGALLFLARHGLFLLGLPFGSGDAVAFLVAQAAVATATLRRPACRARVRALWRGKSPEDRMVWTAAGLGLAIGSFAAWRFPHVLDCGQLIWQGRLQSGHAEGLTGSDGALGFSGLTWWLPDLLSRPLTVAAAATKPALGLFCALGVLRLGRGAWPERPGVAAGLIGLLLLASHYGQMDLLQLGKDSSWAVALTLAFVGTAASTRTSTLSLGILIVAATLVGVVTQPFLLLFLGLWAWAGCRDPDVTRRAGALYLALIPSVALALTATRDTPVWMALAQSAAVLGACAAGARFLMPLAGRIPRFSSTGLGIGALMALLAGIALMPVEVSRVKLIEPGGLLHMHSDVPFDGRCSYWTYLAGYASGVSPLTVLLGLLVAVTLPFMAPSRVAPARMAGTTFIAFAAAAMIVVARVGTVVLNPLNVWDLGRNLPIRFLAPLASFGVLSAIGSLERGRTRSIVAAVACGALLVETGMESRRSLEAGLLASLVWTRQEPHTTPVARLHPPAVARIVTALASRPDVGTLVLWTESRLLHHRGTFQHFQPALRLRYVTDLSRIRPSAPAWILGPADLELPDHAGTLTLVVGPESKESLFLCQPR